MRPIASESSIIAGPKTGKILLKDCMNLSKDPITEATSKVFGLNTAVANTIIELILLVIFIAVCDYVHVRSIGIAHAAAGIFMIVGIAAGLIMSVVLVFKIFAKLVN